MEPGIINYGTEEWSLSITAIYLLTLSFPSSQHIIKPKKPKKMYELHVCVFERSLKKMGKDTLAWFTRAKANDNSLGMS